MSDIINYHDIEAGLGKNTFINPKQHQYIMGIMKGKGGVHGIDRFHFSQVMDRLHMDHTDHLSSFEVDQTHNSLKHLIDEHHDSHEAGDAAEPPKKKSSSIWPF